MIEDQKQNYNETISFKINLFNNILEMNKKITEMNKMILDNLSTPDIISYNKSFQMSNKQ